MNNILYRRWVKIGSLLVLFLAVTFIIQSCSEVVEPPDQQETLQTELSKDNPAVRAVIEVQEKYTARLMNIPEVIGTAVGLTEDGKPCILVLTKTDIRENALAKGMRDPLPQTIDNAPVRQLVTGEIKALKGGGVSHKAIQTPPIQLGTSGGWADDLANGYCCGGTLGSLIQIGGNQYILSNYHVLGVAPGGDNAIQPGLIDVGCRSANAQVVGTIDNRNSLPGSNVDAAIALVEPGMVRADGSILEVGTLSASTVSPSLNKAVKKSGRTTGLTRSSINGLNATVSVSYSDECAGATVFTKTFTGQILVANRGSKFLAGGDSGSLMVEDVSTNPRAVGLLFAGSTSLGVANPIGQVLSYFNASMVGQ